LKEAVELYLEDFPNLRKELEKVNSWAISMSRLPRLSGEEVVKVLVSKFGFRVSRQRGSHAVLVKHVNGRKIGTVVPLYRELKPGTLMGVLRLAEIGKDRGTHR